ncbi:MAG: glycosyltransferase family 39 protein, partial [Bacteroidota bacterium]|nr:glycosyltransferase family 39 protein [Bacteroidota bacterium]
MLNRNSLNIILRYFLYILAVLPVFIFRDFTFDNELRYLSIADEALRNGSVFTFANHGLFYADKPPLYLWLVMLGKAIFGSHVLLFLGIFSFLPALIIMHIMDKWVKDVLSDSERLTGELMLITSGYFIGAALVLRMDMLMCMFIVLSLYTFYKMYCGESKKRDAILFPVYVFLAIFSKGPVGIMVPLLSTVVFLYSKGEIKTIGRYWGWKTLTVLLLLCLAWFTGVYIEGGSNYLNDLLFNQTVNRAVNSFHHKEPIYYYFLSIWYSLAPWSLLYVGILLLGLKKKMITTDLERLFLIIILSTFIALSFISAKLQIYLLPIFPFVAYLTMLLLAKLQSKSWIRLLVGIPALIFCFAFPAAIIAQTLISITEYFTLIVIFIAALILSLTGILAIRGLKNNKLYQSIIMMSSGLLIAIFVVSFAIPAENSFIGMEKLCQQAKNESIHKNINNYYCFNIDRSENLDVYLSKEPKNLTEEELINAGTIIRKPA